MIIDSTKTLLIFNHNAAHGRAMRLLPTIEAYFSKNNIDVETRVTNYPKHALEIVACVDFANYHAVVAAGGDGTLFEVINGYFQNKSKNRIPIGVLPIGTGNSFARDLGLKSGQWQQAIEIIKLNRPTKVDVAYCRSADKDFYFMNVIGLGFVTDVQKVSAKFKALGDVAYTLGVLFQMLFLKSHPVHLELDGQSLERDVSLIEILNTRYTARSFLMAPEAKFNDGFLDVIVGNRVSRIKLLLLFRKVFSGKHIREKEVESFQVKKLTVSSARPLKLGPDGEIYGITPLTIECLPGAVEVFTS